MRPASLGADGALVKGENGTLCNDEHTAQLGEPDDDVVRERVSETTGYPLGGSPVDERHDGNGRPTCCADDNASWIDSRRR
jgi:hypothetical protein